MPGMDGFEFLRGLQSREQGRAVPVVVVTAKELTPDERDVLRQSVETFVQKCGMNEPLSLAAIREKVLPAPARASDSAT